MAALRYVSMLLMVLMCITWLDAAADQHEGIEIIDESEVDVLDNGDDDKNEAPEMKNENDYTINADGIHVYKELSTLINALTAVKDIPDDVDPDETRNAWEVEHGIDDNAGGGIYMHSLVQQRTIGLILRNHLELLQAFEEEKKLNRELVKRLNNLEGRLTNANKENGVSLMSIKEYISKELDDRFSRVLSDIPRGPHGIPGTPGKRGPMGPSGPPGIKGESGGIRGRPGQRGEKGDKGEKGEVGSNAFFSESDDKIVIQGPTGHPGLNGLPGLSGLKGEPGAKGDAGRRGRRGRKGVSGDDGLPGRKGEKGERSMDGLPGLDGTPGCGCERTKRDAGHDGPNRPDGIQTP